MHVIVGTAGHIDHGKTTLVKALTGVDADRLPEEKQRGITIDLGFAEMEYDDARFGFVDVPGHEKFVRNMLAGASGIDLVLLVVAADEGVMPQTREHFDICRMLQVSSGVIALTKTDIAGAELTEIARADVEQLVAGSFLDTAEMVAVSSKTGEGVDQLRRALKAAATTVSMRDEHRDTRLAIDRSFSMKGFGTVVTGTLASGVVNEGDELVIYPPGRRVRVRGLQAFGRKRSSVESGNRTALNLAGVDYDEVTRGMVLAAPGSVTVANAFDAEFELLGDVSGPMRSRQRVRVHIGTSEVLARVAILNADQQIEPGERDLVQFRLESPAALTRGDHFIVRSYSPQRTIGGGRVILPDSPRHRRSELADTRQRLISLTNGNDQTMVGELTRSFSTRGVSREKARALTGLSRRALADIVTAEEKAGRIVVANDVLFASEAFDFLKSEALAAVEDHHSKYPLDRGIPREVVRERLFDKAMREVLPAVVAALERDGTVVSDNDVIRLRSHTTRLSPAEQSAIDTLQRIYSNAKLEPPKLDEALRQAANGNDLSAARRLLQILVERGEIVPVTPEFFFSSSSLAELSRKLRARRDSTGDASIDVGKFKEIAGVSRKYAIPILEYFDRTRVTKRVADRREVVG